MDANKLCSYAMSPFLSTSGFKWIDPKDFHLTTGKVTVVTFHHEKLKLYLRLGLKLKKIHRVLEFNQSQWLKSYFKYITQEIRSRKNGDKMEKFYTN